MPFDIFFIQNKYLYNYNDYTIGKIWYH